MSLTYATQHTDGSARKSGAIAVVVLLHLGFLYAFTHGMNVVTIIKPLKDITTIIIPEEKPPQETLKVPEPVPTDIPLDNYIPDAPIPPPIAIPPDVDVPQKIGDGEITIPLVSPVDPPPLVRSFSIKHRVDPQYPAASRRAGDSGTVLLSVVIGPDGVPTQIDIERSSGFAALDKAAADAVRQWRFTVNSTGYSRVRLPISFRLETTR